MGQSSSEFSEPDCKEEISPEYGSRCDVHHMGQSSSSLLNMVGSRCDVLETIATHHHSDPANRAMFLSHPRFD